jgi:hypothetical protein
MLAGMTYHLYVLDADTERLAYLFGGACGLFILYDLFAKSGPEAQP